MLLLVTLFLNWSLITPNLGRRRSYPAGDPQGYLASSDADDLLGHAPLPQGQPERWKRAEAMVETMEQHFGSCTNHGECSKACPKSISIDFIAMMNRDYVKAKFKNLRLAAQSG